MRGGFDSLMAHHFYTPSVPLNLPMNPFRLIIALAIASMLTTAFLKADESQKQTKEKSETVCSCGKDKEGKECGKDKECCCKPKKEKETEQKK